MCNLFVCAVIFTFSCLSSSVHCYGSNNFDPLGKFIERRHLKKTVDHVTDRVAVTRYSPVYVELQDGQKEVDKILGLPGQLAVNFDQYSGYVTVDPNAGRALFYYFAEAEDPSTKPLVLWLNGGPGCSSLGAGAMMELGPFRVNPDGKTLWHNENAWNNVANVLFLESPAGVGFSYSNTTSDYTTGDTKTAADTYTFLVNWLERFPEYKTRDFYLTGESYAGHYVPQLAYLILQNNKITNQTIINLKGIAIGNAYTDAVDHIQGVYDHLWTSAIISDEIYEGIVKNCNFSTNITDPCIDYLSQAGKAFSNIYIMTFTLPCATPLQSLHRCISGFDPCSSDYVFTYLNIPEVQTALHATTTTTPVTWNNCNDIIGSNWQDSPDTVLPLIKELMTTGISIWIYSGDTDVIVPITTTKYSMPKLESPVTAPWYPWDAQGEVVGYVVEYQNVTFISIRGSGHFVPSYQPQRALSMFSFFIEGKLPPVQKN